MNFLFSRNYVKALQHAAKKAGMQFTLKKIEELLRRSQMSLRSPRGQIEALWEDFQLDNLAPDNILDTYPREIWFNLIGYYYVGRSWPCWSEGEAVCSEFHSTLKQALRDDGVRTGSR